MADKSLNWITNNGFQKGDMYQNNKQVIAMYSKLIIKLTKLIFSMFIFLCGCSISNNNLQKVDIDSLELPHKYVYSYLNDSTLAKGFTLGEMPISGSFNHSCFSFNSSELTLYGSVFLKESGGPIVGAVVTIGKLEPMGEEISIKPRYTTRTDSAGLFFLQGKIEPDDRLIMTHWAFIAAVYNIGQLVKR
jgi:hypothetical protein